MRKVGRVFFFCGLKFHYYLFHSVLFSTALCIFCLSLFFRIVSDGIQVLRGYSAQLKIQILGLSENEKIVILRIFDNDTSKKL